MQNNTSVGFAEEMVYDSWHVPAYTFVNADGVHTIEFRDFHPEGDTSRRTVFWCHAAAWNVNEALHARYAYVCTYTSGKRKVFCEHVHSRYPRPPGPFPPTLGRLDLRRLN